MNERNFKLSKGGEMAYRVGLMGFLIQNCFTCLRGNVVSSMFDMVPPSINEYLPLDEVIPRYTWIGVNENYSYYN